MTHHPYPKPPIVVPARERPIVPGINGFATASLVMGILGCFPVAGILAIVFGILALIQLRSRIQDGKARAIGGLCAAGLWLAIAACWAATISPNRTRAEHASPAMIDALVATIS